MNIIKHIFKAMKNYIIRNWKAKEGNSQNPGRYEKRVDLIQERIFKKTKLSQTKNQLSGTQGGIKIQVKFNTGLLKKDKKTPKTMERR